MSRRRLPPRLYFRLRSGRSGVWVVIFRNREVSTGEECLGRASRLLPGIARSLQYENTDAPLGDAEVREAAYTAYRRSKNRAVIRGVAFLLTLGDVVDMIERQGRRCALTGLPLVMKKGTGRRRPFTPSLDRIDRRGGYTTENLRVVCTIANLARGDFSDEEFYAMCAAAAALRPVGRRSA